MFCVLHNRKHDSFILLDLKQVIKMPEEFVYQKKEREQKRQEDQVKLLIGTGLLLGTLGIAYAIGQAIDSNIQPIKQNFLILFKLAEQHFNLYSPLRIISFFSLTFISIGISKWYNTLSSQGKEEIGTLIIFPIMLIGFGFFFTLFG